MKSSKIVQACLVCAITAAVAMPLPSSADTPARIEAPAPKANGSDTGKKVLGGVAGCVAGGVVLGELVGMVVKWDAKKKGLSDAQAKNRIKDSKKKAQLAGCVVGGFAAVKIVDNLSASAKARREAAWVQAQRTQESVEWVDPNDPNVKGTSRFADVTTRSDGRQCGIRRDTIETSEGTAKPFAEFCYASNGGLERTTEWEYAAS